MRQLSTLVQNDGSTISNIYQKYQHSNIPKVSCYTVNSFDTSNQAFLIPLEFKKLRTMLNLITVMY